MRFVKTQVPGFEELGLPEAIKEIADSKRGIVLVAGSTGCGKSTTCDGSGLSASSIERKTDFSSSASDSLVAVGREARVVESDSSTRRKSARPKPIVSPGLIFILLAILAPLTVVPL